MPNLFAVTHDFVSFTAVTSAAPPRPPAVSVPSSQASFSLDVEAWVFSLAVSVAQIYVVLASRFNALQAVVASPSASVVPTPARRESEACVHTPRCTC